MQIEHYNTGEDTGEDTGVAMAVCSGHTGVYSHRWPMTGIDPILGRVAYATQPTGEEEQRG